MATTDLLAFAQHPFARLTVPQSPSLALVCTPGGKTRRCRVVAMPPTITRRALQFKCVARNCVSRLRSI
jgi:hypothetical protein